jgi:asparagine synthase (glutamine-hydrolysing)
MAAQLAHRGPDSFGSWSDENAGIAIAHRRLAILDLSPHGYQPMISSSGRFVVTYNGEIYNFAALKADLVSRGYAFRGSSDTEVLLAAVDEWGFEGTLSKLTGMFALGIWDAQERVLHLARDRMGEKPLYYGWCGGVFFFGSELSAFSVHPAFRPEISRAALAELVRHGYIPSPHSIYRQIFKLPPGSYLTISIAAATACPSTFSEFADAGSALHPRRYWSLNKIASVPNLHSFEGAESEALNKVEQLISNAVSQQMVADVPVGAFLSGGIDSSLIVALMQSLRGGAIRTFSVGFHEDDFNEAPHAKRVAERLGTEHSELYVGEREMLEVVPQLAGLYSEPFADSSQIPTLLVSRLARQSVTVSLSGDGGDELFGGYTRYQIGQRLWNMLRRWPGPVRRGAAMVCGRFSLSVAQAVLSVLAPILPDILRRRDLRERGKKIAKLLSAGTPSELYYALFSNCDDVPLVVRDAIELPTIFANRHDSRDLLSEIEQMMWLDAMHYLPDDILVKVDRAAMAVSLETRVPFLNHELIEFLWSLPASMRVRASEPKWMLRRILSKHLPRELYERPKMGFGVPMEHWLRGPLRVWAEELLSERRLAAEGFFYPKAVTRMWHEHTSGQRNWQAVLWHILTFQAWYLRQRTAG